MKVKYLKKQCLKCGLCITLSILTLTSCNSLNQTQKLSNKLDVEIKQNYFIDNGYLIALYGLTNANKSNAIYSQDYGRIINDEKYNALFLRKLKSTYNNNINYEKTAKNKAARIKNLLAKLEQKYNFLAVSDKDLIFNSKNKESLRSLKTLDNIASKIPVFNPLKGAITSKYGMRKCPKNKKRKKKLHCGIDIAGGKSSPIYSSADGMVESIKRMNGYGNIVEIKHVRNFKTRYAHLKQIFVREGEKIIRGSEIGTQGKTGNATAEHLHFEILYNNKPIDPYEFISHNFNTGLLSND